MKTSVAGTRLAAPAKLQTRTRAVAPVAASLRQDIARVAKGAGVGIASLGLVLAANAANVKLGAEGGGLAFDPSTVTIKAGESVTWVNNVGFPHNVVFDEDDVPVRSRTENSFEDLFRKSDQPTACVSSGLLNMIVLSVGGCGRKQLVSRGLLELTRTEGLFQVFKARHIRILL